MSRRGIYCLAVLLTLALLAPVLVRHDPGTAQERPMAPWVEAKPIVRELLGNTSCATSVCHGGSETGQPRSEATTWRINDPHAQAYETLLSDASKKIARQLWGEKMLAHQSTVCLNCHVHPDYDPKKVRPNFRKEDGVGCESCHGAAQDWLTPHYRQDWRTTDEKQSKGWTDTKDLVVRATVCAGCHVGRPGADVNHDMIAAGHPALRFEMATYFANLPRHWNADNDQKRTGKQVDARIWEIGQAVSAATALDLLAHRATPAPAGVWPEFAELSCFGCHQDLQPSIRQGREKRQPGALTWNSWYFAMLDPEIPGAAEFKRGRDRFNRRELFSAEGQRVLAQRASQLAEAIRKSLTKPPPGALNRLVKDRPAERSWEETTQHYFALQSLRQAQRAAGGPADTDLEQTIRMLREEVTFREGYASPDRFGMPKIKR